MIRKAIPSEAGILTRLTRESKALWGYPKEHFDIWAPELTILPEYIEKNDVFVIEVDGIVAGYYSMVVLQNDIEVGGVRIGKGHWLEHMFIAPTHIGQGLGTRLFAHCREGCKAKGILQLGILADPNAKKFYEKMGCEYHREFQSTIPGRTTPYLTLTLLKHR